VIVYTVPEQNDTIPGMNGSFTIKVKNGTVEKNITTELDNILAKKIYDLAFSTKDDPVEWEGSGQTPSYLASITDLVQFRKEINSLKGNFTNYYINASDPADSDKINMIKELVPELSEFVDQSAMGNISGWDWIDTPDDAVGTPNGGGSVAIAYNNTGAIVGRITLEKEGTAVYSNIIQNGGTRSSEPKSTDATIYGEKSWQENHGKRDRAKERKIAADQSYVRKSIKEMANGGIYKVYCDRDLLVGYNDGGEIKEVRHIRNGKAVKL
ncbi:MAG: hypothetical protein KKI14_03330, partial [Nanoarchaeota archaeon]|nr:hypothetical protein [Nanoarchaeota archaeon]